MFVLSVDWIKESLERMLAFRRVLPVQTAQIGPSQTVKAATAMLYDYNDPGGMPVSSSGNSGVYTIR